MAKAKITIEVECRNPEEYYGLVDEYKKDGFTIHESDNPKNLNFVAKKSGKMWELDS